MSRCAQGILDRRGAATRISILVPARNEELVLPRTLPAMLRAADGLGPIVEILVITPPDSPFRIQPPVRDTRVRWLVNSGEGKFGALRTGADAARGDILLLVDADVVVHQDAFELLAGPLLAGTADVVAGRITLIPSARTRIQRLLERWALVSMDSWHHLRQDHERLRWALPGAIYGIRSSYFPLRATVPLVDDASIGVQAFEAGATFAYAPGSMVQTHAPTNYRAWLRQKYRSRRGWAELARHQPDAVAELETTFRQYLQADRLGSGHHFMKLQDFLIRSTARHSLRWRPASTGAWPTTRPAEQWLLPVGERE